MSLTYDDVNNARIAAMHQINLVDKGTRDAAKLIVGRLQAAGVNAHTLKRLKKELKNYNCHTGEWK